MKQDLQTHIRSTNGTQNRLSVEDRVAHDWYRFVLSFPPHLVRDYLHRFGMGRDSMVLDPFCGTGTTIVECKKLDIPSVGVEANPFAYFASTVKTDWSPDPDGLLKHAREVAELASEKLDSEGFDDQSPLPLFRQTRKTGPGCAEVLRKLPPEKEKLLLANSISPLPLHKTLVLIECLDQIRDDRYRNHELLALGKTLVNVISNLHFGPEVGVGPAKPDSPVVAPWLATVESVAADLRCLRETNSAPATVYNGDARQISQILSSVTIDAVITSPPYPNEKDYTRTTRLESVLLGFVSSKDDLQALKQGLVRSNTRGVYKGDDDDKWIADQDEIQRIAEAIEKRRIELGKTSGFERQYHKVTKLYFGGMARHLAELRTVLRTGARLAYVVGDQASYLRVMIRTGQLLADIAESLGYQVENIELFRTRLATATRDQLREEVVILRWPGPRSHHQHAGVKLIEAKR
ncbi:DNA methylase [Candidatus Methylomirabilis lanthanidiphila]|uniref:site-specific DNA-methyltransferase (cytosine-N(4)-specific) n=1 Tax=Candidatus Methylomirabilis lanthanidiphila TaxID=2211376 RepID=A0A564ZKQ5_9BACT|nr:site-specific DNA-methyltransferase [Candidatus Methylomirabilis lanthanidiphila]VUZ85915.1 DNA methylase [Candidatus Methylomirabilis lanthanidiphila]